MSKETATALLTGSIATTPAPTTTSLEQSTSQETPSKSPTNPLDSTRFAHLAKKEAQFVKEREQYKKDREAWESEKGKYLDSHSRLEKFNELKKTNIREAIKYAELSEADVVNLLAEVDDKSTPEERASRAAQSEIQKFKDEQTRIAAEATQKRNAEAINGFRQSLSRTLESNKDTLEYCSFHGPMAEELAWETTVEIFNTSGEAVTAKEALELVESFYEEQDKAMSNLNKRKPREQAVQEAKAAVEQLKPEVSPGMPQKATKTLTNRANPSVASTTAKKSESRDEKKARLADMLRNFGKN